MRSFERRTLTRTMIGVVAGLALFAAAGCGSDDSESSTTDAPADSPRRHDRRHDRDRIGTGRLGAGDDHG